jgi:hypothetical protein
MLEILVGLAVLLILNWLCSDKDAVGKNDSDIIPFIGHHDHRDGTEPFANSDDDFDSNWDPDFIDDNIDEDIDDNLR